MSQFEALPTHLLELCFIQAIDAWSTRSSAFGVTLQLLSHTLFEPARYATLRSAFVHDQRGVHALTARLVEDEAAAAWVRIIGQASMQIHRHIDLSSLVKLFQLAPNLQAVRLCLDARGLCDASRLGLGTLRLSRLWLEIYLSKSDYLRHEIPLTLSSILTCLAPHLRDLRVVAHIDDYQSCQTVNELKGGSALVLPYLGELYTRLPMSWTMAIVTAAPELVELHSSAPQVIAAMEDDAVSRIAVTELLNNLGEPTPPGYPIAESLARLTGLVDLTLSSGRVSDVAALLPRSVRRLTLKVCGNVVEDVLYALEDNKLPALTWLDLDAALEWHFMTMSGVDDYDVASPGRRGSDAVMAIWERARLESYGTVTPVTEEELASLSEAAAYTMRATLRRGRQRVEDEARKARVGQAAYRVDYHALLDHFHWSRGVLAAALERRGIDHPVWRYRLVGLATEFSPFGSYEEYEEYAPTLEPEL